jgi:predicted metalloprotease with PDZ domain
MYQIVGKHPCKEYLFIIHHVEEGGGGLEHANSNVVQMQRFAYTNKDRYLNFLSLCAHEYFHLWNVKRIRPEALGPFDYSKENYTNLLWVAEGITSYYDELAMYRAGFRTESEYLRILSNTFSATINRKGAEIQSMHEASFDAWIKEYRPNENSINTNISYYMKGAAIAALLDIELLDATKGSKGLDHLLQYLYSEYYEKKQRGFTDNEFYDAIDYIAGKPLNFKSWAEETNTSETNQQIKNILKKVACSIENKVQNNLLYTGINTEQKGEKIAVKSIDAMSAAFGLDIQAGDEIIAINKIRIKTSLDEAIRLIGEGVKLDFIISRNGLIRDLTIVPVQNPKLDLSISIDKGDDPILLVWLKRI